MAYGLTWTVDIVGDQVYSEMNLAYWWLETQDRLPPAATIRPLISGMDTMQLMDLSGDKTTMLSHLTIGNIYSSISN